MTPYTTARTALRVALGSGFVAVDCCRLSLAAGEIDDALTEARDWALRAEDAVAALEWMREALDDRGGLA